VFNSAVGPSVSRVHALRLVQNRDIHHQWPRLIAERQIQAEARLETATPANRRGRRVPGVENHG
jgi:hypothetical protein